jgi:carboxypeptidase D
MRVGPGRFLACIAAMAAISLSSGCGENREFSQSRVKNAGGELLYVRLPASMLTKDFVKSTSFNRDHAKDARYALGWISQDALDSLTSAQRESITQIDERLVATGRLNPFTMEKINPSFDAPAPAEDYHNYQALTAELRRLADSHPEIARLTSTGKTSEGREIWLMTISDNVDADEREPELLYIANMHGDEVVGREISIYHIRRLLSEYGKNTRVTNLVNNSKIFIIPSMNPDGFERHQRYSAQGVDLNRDFPDFTSDNRDTGEGRAIETNGIMNLHSNHHFAAAVNFHGGEVCFNLPWDTTPNRDLSEKFGDDAVLSAMGRAYADSNRTMEANNNFDRGLTYGYEWYEVDGGMQDWSIWYRQSMHATIELSYAKWPSASYLTTAWNENQEGMLAFHERALTGIHLEVVDSDGKPVSDFEVAVSTANRSVKYKNGVAHRVTSPGAQVVTVSSGAKRGVVNLVARAFDGNFDRVVLR